ncbi:MAG TPA: MerR family transcriptional regulator [Caproiciproducens sp.]|nr:MerR family transcriptional regulator [Caproiciproducens sp.]
MKTYKTSEIAHIIGIHPNTVRLYEELQLIPKPERRPNGYRVYTDLHLQQFRLARTALKVEVLQNGLRKKAVEIIKTSAKCDFDRALLLAEEYLEQIENEKQNAEEAISITNRLLLNNGQKEDGKYFGRKEAAEYLQVTMDTLRNWEMNGLLTVKRKKNGYRVYTQEDISRLKIIRSLRCANYSLSAILRMLNSLSRNPEADVREALETPKETEDIVSVCDKLLTSLNNAGENARGMLAQLKKMKKKFQTNPLL